LFISFVLLTLFFFPPNIRLDVAHAKPGSLRAQCSVLRLRCKRAGCRVAEYDAASRCALWAPYALRACKLVLLGLVVINNGHDVARWRIPGVLQYFGVSGLIVSAVATCVFLSRCAARARLCRARRNVRRALRSARSVGPPAFPPPPPPARPRARALAHPPLQPALLLRRRPIRCRWVLSGAASFVPTLHVRCVRARRCCRPYVSCGGSAAAAADAANTAAAVAASAVSRRRGASENTTLVGGLRAPLFPREAQELDPTRGGPHRAQRLAFACLRCGASFFSFV
jgi:hypothetical protein